MLRIGDVRSHCLFVWRRKGMGDPKPSDYIGLCEEAGEAAALLQHDCGDPGHNQAELLQRLVAGLADLEAELEKYKIQQRYGTPFDPTGAKTGTEINSLRAKVADLEARLEEYRDMLAHTPSGDATVLLSKYCEVEESATEGHVQLHYFSDMLADYKQLVTERKDLEARLESVTRLYRSSQDALAHAVRERKMLATNHTKECDGYGCAWCNFVRVAGELNEMERERDEARERLEKISWAAKEHSKHGSISSDWDYIYSLATEGG
jgi:DNA repair exonuclease SbcCD ATPase subunit